MRIVPTANGCTVKFGIRKRHHDRFARLYGPRPAYQLHGCGDSVKTFRAPLQSPDYDHLFTVILRPLSGALIKLIDGKACLEADRWLLKKKVSRGRR